MGSWWVWLSVTGVVAGVAGLLVGVVGCGWFLAGCGWVTVLVITIVIHECCTIFLIHFFNFLKALAFACSKIQTYFYFAFSLIRLFSYSTILLQTKRIML